MKIYKITIEEVVFDNAKNYYRDLLIFQQRIELEEGSGANDKIKSIIESVNN